MRKFYLELDGVRYGLNGESGVFLDSPTGLGVAFTNTNVSIGNGFYYRADALQNLGQFVANINFIGLSGGYIGYKILADALLTAQEIKLVYDPAGTEYKADASIVSFTKTELQQGGVLTCQLTLDLRGLWYTEQTLTGTGSVSVTAGGQADTGVIVRVSSALTNPDLKLVSNGETIARALLNCTTTGTFEYSNLPTDSHIYDGSGDLIRYVDIDYPIYGRTRSAFSVNLTGASMTVIARKYWRTV